MPDALSTIMSPAPMVFAAGVAVAQLRPGVSLPQSLVKSLAWYLMVAIGLKGGLEIGKSGLTADLAVDFAAAIGLGIVLAALAYNLLPLLTRLAPVDRAALAAHYGSVSVVTFVAAAAFLTTRGIEYEPHLVAIMAVMEAPAIVVGVWLGRRHSAEASLLEPVREALTNPSILMLSGGLLAGYLLAEAGGGDAVGHVREPFLFVLVLFLLHMGLQVGSRLPDVMQAGPGLLAFAVLMPLTGAVLGCLVGASLGMSTGGTTLLAVLGASASYIAAPAAVRLALPDANPTYYGLLPLGVTFPFNIIVGLPLYLAVASAVT